MKARNVFALCAVVLLAASGFAQQNTIVTIFTGYTMTAFDGQASAAGTIPVAASILLQTLGEACGRDEVVARNLHHPVQPSASVGWTPFCRAIRSARRSIHSGSR